jgi:hypothetical protein
MRCGILLDSRRKKLCLDCGNKPQKTISYGNEICIPHRGDFDELDQPMLNGELFLPGQRTCGHADCVNPNHCPGVEIDFD